MYNLQEVSILLILNLFLIIIVLHQGLRKIKYVLDQIVNIIQYCPGYWHWWWDYSFTMFLFSPVEPLRQIFMSEIILDMIFHDGLLLPGTEPELWVKGGGFTVGCVQLFQPLTLPLLSWWVFFFFFCVGKNKIIFV